MKQSFKIVFYAINGRGLGHLSRLWAIAKQVKILADSIRLESEIILLTTSDADFVVKDFPVWKLPSKTQMPQSSYTHEAKMVIANILSNTKPNVLVLDTQAEGAFSEFFFIKDFAEINVFIDRKKDEKYAQGTIQQAHLPLYHLILVPDIITEERYYPIAEELTFRRKFVGNIHRYDPKKALSKAELRAYFAVPEHLTLIYVSAGGGGDVNAGTEIKTIIEGLDANKYFILAGYGALYSGKMVYKSNVIPLTDAEAWRFFAGVDVAICAAGYNTYQELLAAKVPCLFFAQNKGMDRQDERILLGLEKGLNDYLENINVPNLSEIIEKFIQKSVSIWQNLAQLPFENGATEAAFEILQAYFLQNNLPLNRLKLSFSILKTHFFHTENHFFIHHFIEQFIQNNFLPQEKQVIYHEIENEIFWLKSPFKDLFSLLLHFEKLFENTTISQKNALLFTEKYFLDRKNKNTIPNKILNLDVILTDFTNIPQVFHDLILDIFLLKMPKNDFYSSLLIFFQIIQNKNDLSKDFILGTFFDTDETINIDFLNKINHVH